MLNFLNTTIVCVASSTEYGLNTLSGRLFGGHKVGPPLSVTTDVASWPDNYMVELSTPSGGLPGGLSLLGAPLLPSLGDPVSLALPVRDFKALL